MVFCRPPHTSACWASSAPPKRAAISFSKSLVALTAMSNASTLLASSPALAARISSSCPRVICAAWIFVKSCSLYRFHRARYIGFSTRTYYNHTQVACFGSQDLLKVPSCDLQHHICLSPRLLTRVQKTGSLQCFPCCYPHGVVVLVVLACRDAQMQGSSRLLGCTRCTC